VTELLAVMAFAITGLGHPTPSAIDLNPTAFQLAPLVAHAGTIERSEALAEGLEGTILVEVGRDRRAFRTGHIPGARFLDWQSIAIESSRGIELPPPSSLIETMSDLGVGNDARIVVYARNVLDATWAWFVLDTLGHGDRVAILDGGIHKWLKEGRPVAGGEFVPRRQAFSIRSDRKAMISLGELRQRLGSSWRERPLLVDARTTDEYRGDVRGAAVARAGHIPGAFSIAWTRNLEVIDGVPLFRLPEALRALYLPGQSAAGGEVVVYCRTGREASMTYFVLRTLGFQPRLYTGSYVEWSLSPEVPVARTARERGGSR